MSNRWLVLQALAGGSLSHSRLSGSDDTRLLKAALSGNQEIIHLRNCGTAFRFLTAYFAIQKGNRILTGDEAIFRRPVGPLVVALRQLGADIRYLGEEGFPPISIRGKNLEGGKVKVDARLSSQFVSALMLIGPQMPDGLQIKILGESVSLPYTKLTLSMMAKAGVGPSLLGDQIEIPNGNYFPSGVEIEADWSGAAFWYALAGLMPGSNIFLPGLFTPSEQGDSILSELFVPFGVDTLPQPGGGVLLRSHKRLPDFFHFDFRHQPDLFPALAVFLFLAGVPFELTGLENLKIKESDRLWEIRKVLEFPGSGIRLQPDGTLLGMPPYHYDSMPGRFLPAGDHRMAMAFSLLGAGGAGVEIADPWVVRKSYPGFWNDLVMAGFRIKSTES